MPVSTGTARSASDLLKKLNTHLVANGWTKRRGEEDFAVASPKAARYWRLVVTDAQGTFSLLRQVSMQLRTTVGGSNIVPTATFASSGTINASNQIGDAVWVVQYDLGSPTIVREMELTAGAVADNAPSEFQLQWSNDAKTWCTMYSQGFTVGLFGAPNAVRTFQFPDGYISPVHPSGTVARRGGHSAYSEGGVLNRRSSPWCDDIWAWEGPGYDAERRVYFSALAGFDQGSDDAFIQFSASTGLNAAVPLADWMSSQEGSLQNLSTNIPTHFMGGGTFSYWIYSSEKRVIVITKTGVDDYASSYIGFLNAFALPDNYPFPLYVGSTFSTWAASGSSSDANSGNRDMQDPGEGAAFVRDWDNVWTSVYNHDKTSGSVDDWTSVCNAWTWPVFVGVSGISSWPSNVMGDNRNAAAGHWLDRLDPTEQGDLPLWPVTVQKKAYGNLGTLEGVFKIPSGSVLAPEATFTIGADTYRVFTTRAFSAGNHYYAIKEV